MGCGLLLLVTLASAQTAPPNAVSLPTDRQAAQKLLEARELLQEGSAEKALRIVQSLLDAREDILLPLEREEPSAVKAARWQSARTEAARILATLSPKAREVYEVTFGDQARTRLTKAEANEDWQDLEEVARRYLPTRAGFDAMTRLALHHLDRGQPRAAAGCFRHLLQHHRADTLPPVTLLHAALAFHRGGERALEEQAWKLLVAKAGGDEVRIAGRAVSLDEVRQEFDRQSRATQPAAPDWPLFRGHPDRTAIARGVTPLLEPRWQADTISQSLTRTRIGQGIAHLNNLGQPVLPAFFPIAVEGKLIYRSYRGIHAVHLKTGAPAWPEPASLKLSLDNLLGDLGGPKQQLTNAFPYAGWWERYTHDWSILFENATIGTLSADRQHVYAIEDLPLPPHPTQVMDLPPGARPFSKLTDAVYHNQLKAFDLATGSLAWQIGGQGTGRRGGPNLAETFFLGPPLPLGGRLYVLAEKNSELSLLCLHPGSGDVLWSQSLAGAADKILLDVGRRVHSAHLAYAEGVLVCPTNAGALLAIDPMTRNLLWAHLYRDKGLTNPEAGTLGFNPGFVTSSWKASAPVIADGKVAFTAADGDTLRCLDLHDGSLLWKVNRLDDDCFLAGVYRDKVLLVGRSACRALHLTTGHEVWRCSTGTLSGQGVASGTSYYLPLRRGGICVLDIETGKEQTFIASNTGDAPGNLLFCDGTLVSQSVNRVVLYPPLESRAARTNGAPAEDIKDPARLLERGVYHLDQGELTRAVADLRAALANQPAPEAEGRARAKLYEALTRLFERDFAAAEPFLAEYRDLCRVPVPTNAASEECHRLQRETRRRLIVFNAQLARGREEQGRFVEALRAYVEVQATARDDGLLFRLDQEPVERLPGVWAAGRIGGMIARADQEQRGALEKTISDRWQQLRTSKDAEAVGRFVTLFGHSTKLGKEARLHLAELLFDDPGRTRWLEAEQHLLQMSQGKAEPELAARALEALARLMTRQGLLEDAVFYYRRLAKDFPRVVVREGKTGADLLEELSADKRFLPYVSESRSVWDGRALVVSETEGQFPFKTYFVLMDAEGELTPSLARGKLVLDLHASRFRWLDRVSGVECWSRPVSLGPLRSVLQQVLVGLNDRLPYQVRGHLAVIPLGPLVVALDLADRRVLWQREWSGAPASSELPLNFDGTPRLLFVDGWSQKLGPAGPAEAPWACLQTRQGLTALDPVSGTVLWTRTDVTGQAETFGDQTHCYLVEQRSDGDYGGTRALRTFDGAAVPVPDFAALYAPPGRQAVLGRHLLLADRDDQERLTLRLYDVQTGQNIWKQEYPAKTLVVQTTLPGATGVLDPTGMVTVFEAQERKELFRAALDPRHVEQVEAVWVFRDRTQWYVAIKLLADQKRNENEAWPNVQGGLTTVPVNGMLYAFDRATGQLAWYRHMPNQMVVLDQVEESPVLLFTAAVNRPMNQPGHTMPGVTTRSVDKRTGKLLWNKEAMNNNDTPFHAVQIDVQAGTVDLLSQNLRIRHAVK